MKKDTYSSRKQPNFTVCAMCTAPTKPGKQAKMQLSGFFHDYASPKIHLTLQREYMHAAARISIAFIGVMSQTVKNRFNKRKMKNVTEEEEVNDHKKKLVLYGHEMMRERGTISVFWNVFLLSTS